MEGRAQLLEAGISDWTFRKKTQTPSQKNYTFFPWMKAGGDHAVDPRATKMAAGLRRGEFANPLTEQAAEDDDGEVELSLGLSIGGGNKRKVCGGYLNGSVGDSVDPNRKCRARVEAEGGLLVSDIRIRNPVVDPNPNPMSVVPVPGAPGLSCMVACCCPPVVSDSGRSFMHLISCRSLQPLAGPDHCPNPNRRTEIGGKSRRRIRRGPLNSASPSRSYSSPFLGRSSSSSEDRSSSKNLSAAEKPKEQANQEVVPMPRVQSPAPAKVVTRRDAKSVADQMPCVKTRGADGRTVSGFLYGYNKEEVSIVCVCHGSCFLPAGFVRHAGGVESSHPLRQITVVVPS